MAASPEQAATQLQGVHLVLYDGVCGLCNRLVQFLLKNDRRAVFSFASLQSAMGKALVARWGGDPEDLTSFYVVTDFRTPDARVVTKSAAVLFVARELGWPWKLARVAGILPAALRDRLYNVVARSRYRVFGRYEQCLIPSEESRSRFIE